MFNRVTKIVCGISGDPWKQVFPHDVQVHRRSDIAIQYHQLGSSIDTKRAPNMQWAPALPMVLWQIGPNLSSGIRWCLALTSVRPWWCLLWRFYVCACVFGRVNGGSDLVCVMKACLIRVICVNCAIRNLGIYQMLCISGTCNVCSSCVLWLDPSPALVMSVSKWGC